MAQTVKSLPAMREMQVRSLDQEDPLRRKWQPTLVFLPEESHGQRRHGVARVGHNLETKPPPLSDLFVSEGNL